MPQFTPVFQLDQDQFIVCTNDFMGESDADAIKIGLGASLVECIMWGGRSSFTRQLTSPMGLWA